ncbi:MAG TPA: hypothetical protein VHM02_14585 [Thermoanaerobaculia bacterium]|nr:hypothetical protein [Thermoanaerobaculia bacterium]
MSADKRIFWTVVALAVAGVAALVLWPRVERRVAPRPTAAWVAIEVEGSGVARVAPVSVEAGTPFTLHAVLGAETRGGETIYYTQAPALAFGDGAPVAAEALRPWPEDRPAKVLWFTVEGPSPFAEAPADAPLDDFQLVEFLRSDWPFAWSIPGRVEPAHDDVLAAAGADAEAPFGTQRYQVRIEVYAEEGAVMPAARYASWGKDALPERLAAFPTVRLALPGVAGPASEVFGLTQVEAAGPPGSAGGELRRKLVELTRQRLAFSRVPLLGEILAAAGVAAGEVPWQPVELAGRLPWGERVHPGDLLRAGDRVVVLFRDAAPAAAPPADGTPPPITDRPGNGRLDGDDLCLDYVRGAAIRRLSDVFDLTAEGTLAWAPIGG